MRKHTSPRADATLILQYKTNVSLFSSHMEFALKCQNISVRVKPRKKTKRPHKINNLKFRQLTVLN